MLQDPILNSAEFLRLLQKWGTQTGLEITRARLDMRTLKGEMAYAVGCRINAHFNEFLPLDAVAVMMTSILSNQLGSLKAAADQVHGLWETWLKLVHEAENDPRLYDEKLQPPDRQQWLIFGLENNPPKVSAVAAGLLFDCFNEIGGPGSYPSFAAISFHQLLRTLRDNARLYKVDLPNRLTPLDLKDAKWLEEIAAYQKLAAMRFEAKAKAKRAKAKELA